MPESGNASTFAQELRWICFVVRLCVDYICKFPIRGQLRLRCQANKWHERRCFKWKSCEGLTHLENVEQQTTKGAPNEFPSSSWNPRAGGGKKAVCSFHLWTTVWLVPPVSWRCTRWLTDVWKDNVIGFWQGFISWGKAPCLPLWYLWHRRTLLWQSRWHLRREKTSHSVSNTEMCTMLDKRWIQARATTQKLL